MHSGKQSNLTAIKDLRVTTLQLFHRAHEDIPDVLSDMGDAGAGQVTPPLTKAPAASVQWEGVGFKFVFKLPFKHPLLAA